jgi:hypothetical protein
VGVGTIDNGVWVVGDLAPGETAEITFNYTTAGDAPVAAASVNLSDDLLAALIATALSIAGLFALATRRNPFGMVTLPV